MSTYTDDTSRTPRRLHVWKFEPGVDWKAWGLGILTGDPEGLREDVGLLLWVGPFHVFLGYGMRWPDGND